MKHAAGHMRSTAPTHAAMRGLATACVSTIVAPAVAPNRMNGMPESCHAPFRGRAKHWQLHEPGRGLLRAVLQFQQVVIRLAQQGLALGLQFVHLILADELVLVPEGPIVVSGGGRLREEALELGAHKER
eukprot:7382650-Prymnesium_polylepis.1